MTGLVDWAPNAHALIVHLPIGLLVTAFAAEIVALLRRRPEPVATVSTALYAAGWLTLAAAYLTGRAAAPEVYTPGLAVPVVDRHWTLALWCLLYFGTLTAGRLWVLGIPGRPRRAGGTGETPAGAGCDRPAGGPLRARRGRGRGPVAAGRHRRARRRLVYQYGVGVAAPLAE